MLDKMKFCADMNLTNAIEDMAKEEHISFNEARDRIIDCGGYDSLYNFDTGLWKEGPDYFRYFVKILENKNETNQYEFRNS